MNRPAASRIVATAYGGALLVLAWIGLGVVQSLTGRDLGAGFQPAYLLLAVAVLAELTRRPPARTWHAVAGGRPWSPLLAGALLVVAISAAGLIARPAPAPADVRWLRFGKQAVQLGIMLCFVILPAAWTRGEARWRLTGDLLAWGVTFQAVYGAVQAIHFHHPLPWFATLDGWFTSNPAILAGSRELYLEGGFTGIPRLRGTACEPLYLGNYLLLALPLLLQPGRRRWHAVAAAAGLLLLLATWARGAWLAAVAGGAVGIVLARRVRPGPSPGPGRRRAWLAALGVLLLGTLLLAGPQGLLLPVRRLGQSLDMGDWSNLTRLYSMQAGWRAFLLSPLWGVGWGQFAFHFPVLVDPLGLQSQFAWPVVNNFPLQILCETGLLGFGVFLAAASALLAAVWRGTGQGRADAAPGEDAARRRLVLVAAATVAVWSQLLTFSQYNLPHIWVAPGLLLAALREARPGCAAGEGDDRD